MNETIKRACSRLLEVLKDKDEVRFSDADGELPSCAMHAAVDRLTDRGLVETFWRDELLSDGTNDYTISLTDRGRRRLGKKLKYPRIEGMATSIDYRKCNVFRKLQIIVSELR